MSEISTDSDILSYFQQTRLYPWLIPVWQQIFNDHVASDNFPHALLLSGVADIGKIDLAFYLAKGLLCQHPQVDPVSQHYHPCHQCRSCQLFHAGNHPDLFHLTTPEDKKVIPVDSIREVIQWSVLSSQLNGKKVILIEPAEAMNQNAANSLLKTLEEPVPGTVIILVSNKKHALLPTIKSRCQCIEVSVPQTHIALNWLESQQVQQPQLMLSLASGAPLKAQILAQGEQMQLRKNVIEQFLSIHSHSTDPVLIAEELVKLTKKNKNNTSALTAFDIVVWMDAIVTDIARLSQNCHESAINNIDYLQSLQQTTNRLYLKKVMQLSDSINKAYFSIQGSMNLNLLFEQLLIDWKNCKN
jgi:DNA polymerase-3 subunit delta'